MNQTDEQMGAADILKKPYARQIVPEPDGSFRAEIIEFPGCIALADSKEAALASIEATAKSWIEAALENGQSIPEPIETTAGYSGKLVLRLPKSLHKKAAYAANYDGVSLNQFIVAALATQVGESTASSTVVGTQLLNTIGISGFPGSIGGIAGGCGVPVMKLSDVVVTTVPVSGTGFTTNLCMNMDTALIAYTSHKKVAVHG